MLIIISQIHDTNDYEKFVDFSNILIYNKSNMTIDNTITIPKKSHKAYSLYHYIYNNYENLTEDYYIFISLHTELYEPNTFPSQVFLDNIWYYIENEKTINIDFKSLSDYYTYINTDEIINRNDESNLHLDHEQIQLGFKNFYIKLFSSFESITFKYHEGFNFILSKKSILSRPRDFYHNILIYLMNDTYDENNFFFPKYELLEKLTEKIFTGNFNIYSSSDSSSDCSSDSSSDCSSDCSSEHDGFNSPNICLKPPLNYCDYCNKLEIVKPTITITLFCSENCKEKYYSSMNTLF